jgi:hypothetical protein
MQSLTLRQKYALASLAAVFVGALCLLLWLSGAFGGGGGSGGVQVTMGDEQFTVRSCDKIGTYADDGQREAVSGEATKFGLHVGGSAAGSLLTAYDSDAALESDPRYAFFGRQEGGAYADYADGVLTWDFADAEAASLAPRFAADPRYVVVAASTATRSQMQVVFVQPVFAVAVQRVDLDERLDDVRWLGNTLGLVLLAGGSLQHREQSELHHWVPAPANGGVVDEAGGVTAFACGTSERLVAARGDTLQEYAVDAKQQWSALGGAMTLPSAAVHLAYSADALWLVAACEDGVVYASARSDPDAVFSAPVATAARADGPVRMYLNTRLYARLGGELVIYARVGRGGADMREEQRVAAPDAGESDFHVDQLAVDDGGVGLFLPGTKGRTVAVEAECISA